jgi:hypothetical protein
MSNGTAWLDIWDCKTFGDPAHSLTKRDSQDPHNEVYVRVRAKHVADKTAHTVTSLEETQGGISITMSVVLWTPTFCALAANP